jgi:hypothetical protein
LQHEKRHFNRKTRLMLYRAAGVLSLALWLFMAAAELYSPLHAWMHGGAIPKDDTDCAIVLIAHGKIDTAPCAAPVSIPVTGVEVAPLIELSVSSTAIAFLPNGRAPPVFSAVS